MLIACPACASEYEIESGLVGTEGRSVRCAACSETWFVPPETAAQGDAPAEAGLDPWEAALLDEPPAPPAEPAAVIDQPAPPPRAAKPRRPPAKSRLNKSGLKPARPRLTPALAAALAACAILPLALLGRTTVVRAMPRTAGLFAAVGLPVNVRGVDLRDVAAFRNPAEAGRPAQLVVEGDLVAVARERVAVSSLEVVVRDAAGTVLKTWTFAPSRAALEPGETARFRSSLAAPPAQGSQVEVRFADASGDTASEAPSAADAHRDAH